MLDNRDWGKLYRWAQGTVSLCTTNPNEQRMLSFLVRKTIGFHKFDVYMKNEDFKKPWHGSSLVGFPDWSRWTIWKVLNVLKEKKIVFHDYEHNKKGRYIYNLSGVVDLWKGTCPYANTDNEHDAEMTNLLETAKEFFMKKNKSCSMRHITENKTFLTMKQAMKEGNEISKKGREKAKQKLMTAKELSVLHVFELMKDYCKEVGVGFFTPVFSKGKKGRTCGSCQNFLDAYEKEGKSADVIRHLLYRVCVNWYRFRTNTLRYSAESSGFVNLGSLVNPLDFFNYRNQIEAWLAANPDLEEEEGNPDDYVTVIDR